MALPSFPHPAGNVVHSAGGNSIQSSKSATALCSCASVTLGFNAALAEPGQSAPQGAGTASQSAYRLTEYGSSHSEKLRWPTAFVKPDRYDPVVCVSEPLSVPAPHSAPTSAGHCYLLLRRERRLPPVGLQERVSRAR